MLELDDQTRIVLEGIALALEATAGVSNPPLPGEPSAEPPLPGATASMPRSPHSSAVATGRPGSSFRTATRSCWAMAIALRRSNVSPSLQPDRAATQ